MAGNFSAEERCYRLSLDERLKNFKILDNSFNDLWTDLDALEEDTEESDLEWIGSDNYEEDEIIDILRKKDIPDNVQKASCSDLRIAVRKHAFIKKNKAFLKFNKKCKINKAKSHSNDCDSDRDMEVRNTILEKLSRQERVAEEAKLVLLPFYRHHYINNAEYKYILRRAVPAICHHRSKPINPKKIKQFIEDYVRVILDRRTMPSLCSLQYSEEVQL